MVEIIDKREWKEGDEPFFGGKGVIVPLDFGRSGQKRDSGSKTLSAEEQAKAEEEIQEGWREQREKYEQRRPDWEDHLP